MRGSALYKYTRERSDRILTSCQRGVEMSTGKERERFDTQCNHLGMWREISNEELIGGKQKITFKCIGCGTVASRIK